MSVITYAEEGRREGREEGRKEGEGKDLKK
jgi:hypothetical protein